jgi:dienelactone hydrolase
LEHLDAMLPALGVRAGLPGWALSHLEHTRVHAVWGAPLGGDGPLGVVTFDHGRGGFAAQNTFLAEDLASHGWLVVAPEHPGGAVLTVFRDGTRVSFDPASFGEGLEGEAYREAIRALGRRWAVETSAALDALAGGAGPAGLAARLDLERLVTSGHSTGGGAAFGLCRMEPGCRATIGLDPWLLPTPPEVLAAAPDGGLPVRVAGLFSDPALGFFEPENLLAFGALARATNEVGGRASETIYPGAGHMDFADAGLLSPVADRLGLYVGPTPPREVLPRIRAEARSVLEQVADGFTPPP